MAQLTHTILIDNEMTALADDFRGIGELIDICTEHDVSIGVGIKENMLTVFTDDVEQDTAESIRAAVVYRAPVFVDIEN